MKLKKYVVGLLVCFLVVSLCSCGLKLNNKDTQSDVSSNDSSEQTSSLDNTVVESSSSGADASSSIDSNQGASELISIFDDINTNYHLGTSGQSLNAMQKEIKLLNWASATNMSIEDIKTETSNYINKLDDDTKNEFINKLSTIDSYRSQFLVPDEASSVLDITGLSDYSWNSDIVNGPLDAIMQTAGA